MIIPEMSYPLPKNETQRLKSLYEYQILDSLPEKEYDSITKIAAQICNVQASLITLLDKDRQWFKSNFGFEIRETPRALSFCNFTILDPDHITVVPDMRNDIRFSGNPLVTGEPHAVFYAGAPLVMPDGYVLGSICVLDGKANDLNEDQREALLALANQVVTKLELSKKVRELSITQTRLNESNKNLRNFARIVSHDMKTPLANILLMSRSVKACKGNTGDKKVSSFLDMIDLSTKELLTFIDQMLVRSENIDDTTKNYEKFDPAKLISQVINLIAPSADMNIKISGKLPIVFMDRTSLQQIFQNLITNAIKYNDKKKGYIKINASSDNKYHHFVISDNGMGIEKKHLSKIFSGKPLSEKKDRFGNSGTGIGLQTVKTILQKAGGKIKVSSEISKGTVFKISIPV